MDEDKVYRSIQGLRAPERLTILEADRVASLTLQDHKIQSALDVGTGSGIFAEVFVGLGLDVMGIDIQEPMLAAARKLVPGARFELGPAEALPFTDGSFDLCFLGLILHESSSPLRTLQEAHRVASERVALLEWSYKEQEMGPPLNHRLKAEDVLHHASALGFSRTQAISLEYLVLFLLDK
jgi:ubiquinone/menaquinone biosynthesis C-methylase UbiE